MSGHIFVLIGPSGVGKTTLANQLSEEGIAHRIVTWTTRSPRSGEVPGQDYVFVSPDRFVAAFHQGELVEREQIYETWYGTPVAALQDALQQNKLVVISMGLEGASAIKARWPQASTTVAILPPNPETLYQRLIQRGASEKDLVIRSSRMKREIELARPLADFIIINDVLLQATERLKLIVDTGRRKLM